MIDLLRRFRFGEADGRFFDWTGNGTIHGGLGNDFVWSIESCGKKVAETLSEGVVPRVRNAIDPQKSAT